MKKLIIKSLVLFISFSAIFLYLQSCNDTATPPKPTNDEELITTMKVELKDSASGVLLNYYFRDLDGEGANPPSQWDTIKLFNNRTYSCAMKFLNESNPNSIINITNEILAEQQSHIICFEPVGANLKVQRTDRDTTFEVGLASKWKSGAGFQWEDYYYSKTSTRSKKRFVFTGSNRCRSCISSHN